MLEESQLPGVNPAYKLVGENGLGPPNGQRDIMVGAVGFGVTGRRRSRNRVNVILVPPPHYALIIRQHLDQPPLS
jgi:hypothetical protein